MAAGAHIGGSWGWAIAAGIMPRGPGDPGLSNDSAEFCRRMLLETGVAATPGMDFDPVRGHNYMRFSFAGSEVEIAEAARRLVAWSG